MQNNNNFQNGRYGQMMQNSLNGFQTNNNFNQFNLSRNMSTNNQFKSIPNFNNNFNLPQSYSNSSNNYPVKIGPLSQNNNNTLYSNNNKTQNKKKYLYVKLTNEEKGYYSNLFQLVDSENLGKLKAKDAANFMKKSGLNKDILKSIWLISSHTSKTFLERDEFYVALRLIALAQNNMPYTSQNIELNRPIPPLPNFNLKKDILSDEDIKYNLTDEEKIKLKRFFDTNKDGNGDNISASKAIQMWRSTGANDDIIKNIAMIMKPMEKKGFLNLREFQVATHLINLSNNHQIPNKLPIILLKYLGRPLNNNNNFIENNNNNGAINNNLNNNNVNNGINLNENMGRNFMNMNIMNSMNSMSNIGCQQLVVGINNNFNNFGNNNDKNKQTELQKTMKEIEELNQKNEYILNQINFAKNRINEVLKEIDNSQNEQINIKNQLNFMKQKCSSLMGNLNINSFNLNNNIISNNNNVNLNNNNIISNNNNVNLNNNNGISNNKYLNQSQQGIGPSKTIINIPDQDNEKTKHVRNNTNEDFEKLNQQKQKLLDLMAKMQIENMMSGNISKDIENKKEDDKKSIENNIVENINNENNNKNIETLNDKIKNKDLKISSKESNKFDEILLESQNFNPEDIISAINVGDFNFGDEEIDKKNFQKIEFGENSPIDKKEKNFLMPNSSLGNNDNNINNGANFGFDDISGNEEHQPIQNQNKDSFNFDKNTMQKDADDWDF